MAKVDFITLAKIIFGDIDKDKYKFISDEEKEASFFMLNRKFAIKYLKQAQFFNDKNINKSSVIDIWYQIFYNVNGTPQWWWNKKTTKPKSDISNADLKLIKQYYDLKDGDINFLMKYYKDKLKEDIKRIKKYETNSKQK